MNDKNVHVNVDTDGKHKIDVSRSNGLHIDIDKNKNNFNNQYFDKSNKKSNPNFHSLVKSIETNKKHSDTNSLILKVLGVAMFFFIAIFFVIYFSMPVPPFQISNIESRGNIHIDISKKTNTDIRSEVKLDGSKGQNNTSTNTNTKTNTNTGQGSINDQNMPWYLWIGKKIWGWIF